MAAASVIIISIQLSNRYLLGIFAQPDCGSRAIPELAKNLISRVEDVTDLDGVILVGFVVWECFFFNELSGGYQDRPSFHGRSC